MQGSPSYARLSSCSTPKSSKASALTGAPLWEFAGGAGFSTNPLVVEGRVIVGNRDGALYAIGAHGTAQQGQLVWRYDVGEPFDQSPAYQDGVVYFVGGDIRADAVRAPLHHLVFGRRDRACAR